MKLHLKIITNYSTLMFFTNDENTVTYLPVYQCTIVCSIRSLSVSEVAAIRRSISMHLTFYFEGR
ncbi:hypothetical protein T08_2706 [Trichinella sp. T8]|nr:hypothetical protein T08_2706 [Trichinella sp. T8]